MPATVRCIRCNKTIAENEARRDIHGFEHCLECYDEVINPKPKPVAPQRPQPTAIAVAPPSTPTEIRATLTAVDLSIGDWFTISLKMFIGGFLAGLVIAIPVFIFFVLFRVGASS